jgi:ferredoxin
VKKGKKTMNISRKEFFRKSLLSLGEAVFTVSDALKNPAAAPMEIPDTVDFEPTPGEEEVAVANNEQCLARNSGCFACMERCATDAIKLIPGVGIGINQQQCNGCGTCQYVCPVTPKAVKMQARSTIPAASVNHAGLPR